MKNDILIGPQTQIQSNEGIITYQDILKITMETLKRTRKAIKRDIKYLENYLKHIEDEGELFTKKYKQWSSESHPEHKGMLPIKLQEGNVIIPTENSNKSLRLLCDDDMQNLCCILGCENINTSRFTRHENLSHLNICNAHRQVLTSKIRYITNRSGTSFKVREHDSNDIVYALSLRHNEWCLLRPSPDEPVRLVGWDELEFIDTMPRIEAPYACNKKRAPTILPCDSDSSESS